MKSGLSKLFTGLALAASGGLFFGCGSSGSTPASGTNLSQVGQSAAGANLVCPSSGHNAYTTYGAAAFVSVTKLIIANVGTELTAHGTTNLGGSFATAGTGSLPANQDNGTTFGGKLAAFLEYVYGGPQFINYTVGTDASSNPIIVTFDGPQSMLAAHTGFNITTSQYNYFVTNAVVPALQTAGVPSGDISACFAPPLMDANFVASIVGH